MFNEILISGAAGFVGSHLIEAFLLKANTTIWGIVRNEPPKNFSPNIHWLVHDLSHPLKYRSLPKNVDIIIHCASPMGEDVDEKEIFQVNVRATMDLLDYAEKAGVKRFIYISSGGVSGNQSGSILERNSVKPETPYLKAKSAGEFVVQSYHSKIPWVIIRPFFPYGSGQKKGLIPRLCKQIWSHQPVFIAKNGGPKLNPIHIKDAVRFIHAIVMGEMENFIINVAGSEIITIKDLAFRIGELLSHSPVFDVIEGDRGNIVGSTDLLYKSYEVSAHMNLGSGLEEITLWWLDFKSNKRKI